MVDVWVIDTGGRGCWSFDADELVVFAMDVATVGHSTSEFTYPEGPVPSLTIGRGQASRSGNQRSTARNKLS